MIPTGRQRLEDWIKRARERHGPDHPLVKDFEKQLAAMPKQSESTPDRWVGAGSATKPQPRQELEKEIGRLTEQHKED